MRGPFPTFDVTVTATELVTPHMKRITIDASAVAARVRGLPTEWLKVFVPGTATGRAYTIRRFTRATGALELDFVLHGDVGPASAWAARAEVGTPFRISAPHPRSGFAWDPSVADHLLFGDETALPAIASLLASLRPTDRARVFVALRSPDAKQPLPSTADVAVTWLENDLAAALPFACGPSRSFDVWAAGESTAIRTLRDHFRATGITVHATGYWKRGIQDFRDEEP